MQNLRCGHVDREWGIVPGTWAWGGGGAIKRGVSALCPSVFIDANNGETTLIVKRAQKDNSDMGRRSGKVESDCFDSFENAD